MKAIAELGGLRGARLVGTVFATLLALPGTAATASTPIYREAISTEEVILLYDMAAGEVRDGTLDAVAQGLLAHDFGNFAAGSLLGFAVREGFVAESHVRAAFARYGCDRDAVRRSFACGHTLDSFEPALSLVIPESDDVPVCVGNGANLFLQKAPLSLFELRSSGPLAGRRR
jgi:hypothetical protein